MNYPPRITIVTPSFNQGRFLEETIVSVLDQGYPNLEYMIIDGGSTDNSREIIRKYERHFSYWVSEPDRGQSHAINKGFCRATGDIFGWINSDDVYTKGTLVKIGESWAEREFNFLYGKCEIIAEDGRYLFDFPYVPEMSCALLVSDHEVPQPSTFFSKRVWNSLGPLDEGLDFGMDFDYWVRGVLAGFKWSAIPVLFSQFRLHDKSKTVTSMIEQHRETEIILDRILKTKGAPKVRSAIARCYRRYSLEHYYWFNDRKKSMHYFVRMLQMNPLVCDRLALKTFVKNVMGIGHRSEKATVL